jgi:streptogramin lyase
MGGFRSPFCITAALALVAQIALAEETVRVLAPEKVLAGRVVDEHGQAVAGAQVSIASAAPVHRVSVFTDSSGRYATPVVRLTPPFELRVRRLGWRDLEQSVDGPWNWPASVTLQHEMDPAGIANLLPANHWYARVLDRLEVPSEREEFARQCTFCHQQGSRYTRVLRDEAEWSKVILLMGRRGAMLTPALREKLPRVFNEAYQPETAVPELVAAAEKSGALALPSREALGSVVEEWDLGGPGSMQHDVMWHPDGGIYGVDMPFDKLHRLDPVTGARKWWKIPDDGLPLGGAFANKGTTPNPASDERVGPHSLQHDSAGNIWITLAVGNRLAKFDPKTEKFEIVRLKAGFYPHTLRVDPQGRIWFTITASNHVGMYDPATGEDEEIRLPHRTYQQAMISATMPFLMWLGQRVDLRGPAAEGKPINVPTPYGIDISPDGTVWFSQLNEHRIGRVDPKSFDVEVFDTPFPGPRRLRFDSKGYLWIPSFSGAELVRFDPNTREWKRWALPTEPRGSETPYALHVDRKTDTVWICGTASDTMIHFEPETERWTIYPLPTRVTFTREVDFDDQGRVWTSNSNAPAWQIEGGVPRVLRLDPRSAPGGAVAEAASGD